MYKFTYSIYLKTVISCLCYCDKVYKYLKMDFCKLKTFPVLPEAKDAGVHFLIDWQCK